ncbi:unnamed protein product [Pedinophyceae sp. YPF-701]|nr:unnamed protein product [Pedinophyceae sp. YPF-701]
MGVEWRRKWAEYFTVQPPPHPTYDLEQVIQAALDEDAGGLGDITTLSTVPEGTEAEATFLAKDDGVLAGVGVAEVVIRMVDATLELQWFHKDGARVNKGDIIGKLSGRAQPILVAERVALNFMQRMSGIATATAQMVAAAGPGGARIMETRKTVPGLRLLDKWAVLVGGGVNHRIGLYDMAMIKDNHIAAAGGLAAACSRCDAYLKDKSIDAEIEVETRTLEEVQQACAYLDNHKGATRVARVMLDNMVKREGGGVDTLMLEKAVEMIGGRCATEASGNVTLETVGAIAAVKGLTYVSCGALTHSVKALDISLNIETQ